MTDAAAKGSSARSAKSSTPSVWHTNAAASPGKAASAERAGAKRSSTQARVIDRRRRERSSTLAQMRLTVTRRAVLALALVVLLALVTLRTLQGVGTPSGE